MITFDTSGQTGTGSGNNLSMNLTLAAGAVLFAFVGDRDSGVPTAATFDGESPDYNVPSPLGDPHGRLFIWVAPTTGSSASLQVNFSASGNRTLNAVSLLGVDTADPVGSPEASSSSGTTVGPTSLTTLNVDSWLFYLVLYGHTSGTFSATQTGQTKRTEVAGGTNVDSAVSTVDTNVQGDGSAGSYQAGYSYSGSSNSWRTFIIEVNAVPTVVYAISGTVTLSGTPVQGATVRCIRQSDNVALDEQTTDSTGQYEFSNLDENETYHVAVEYEQDSVLYNALSLWDVSPVEVE